MFSFSQPTHSKVGKQASQDSRKIYKLKVTFRKGVMERKNKAKSKK